MNGRCGPRRTAWLLATLLIAAGTTACTADEDTSAGAGTTGAGAEETELDAAVEEDAPAVTPPGPTVTEPVDVVEVLTDQTFVAEGLSETSGDPVLVVHQAGIPLEPGQTVEVTGKVRTFDEAMFEEQLGLELDDQALGAWTGRSAVLALEVAPGGTR
ncbi:hypothetical protein ACI8AC_07345 [Geodermatophilus sp. SYSU D00758]